MSSLISFSPSLVAILLPSDPLFAMLFKLKPFSANCLSTDVIKVAVLKKCSCPLLSTLIALTNLSIVYVPTSPTEEVPIPFSPNKLPNNLFSDFGMFFNISEEYKFSF